MTILLLGLAIFLGMHSLSVFNHDARNRLVARLGEKPWKGIYSVVSLLGFVLIVVGYGAARGQPVVLYQPPVWTRHIALLLMVPVFVLVIASNIRTNSAIKRATKHPLLLATKLWATAHLISNGNLADVLLFAGFLAWAVLTRISLKRRVASPVPNAANQTAAARSTVWPDVIAVVVGLAFYAWFLLKGHAWLIGVSPIAR
jgi:uncharacterized membrane protein